MMFEPRALVQRWDDILLLMLKHWSVISSSEYFVLICHFIIAKH